VETLLPALLFLSVIVLVSVATVVSALVLPAFVLVTSVRASTESDLLFTIIFGFSGAAFAFHFVFGVHFHFHLLSAFHFHALFAFDEGVVSSPNDDEGEESPEDDDEEEESPEDEPSVSPLVVSLFAFSFSGIHLLAPFFAAGDFHFHLGTSAFYHVGLFAFQAGLFAFHAGLFALHAGLFAFHLAAVSGLFTFLLSIGESSRSNSRIALSEATDPASEPESELHDDKSDIMFMFIRLLVLLT